MTYQLRHREYGVFQGEFWGMGFRHSMSEMPEQGFCEFPTYQDAAGFRAFLCSPESDGRMSMSDLTIEPFDDFESLYLQFVGMLDITERERVSECSKRT